MVVLWEYTSAAVLTLATLVSMSPTPAEDSKQLVVLDVDPGIDDALAILVVLGDPNYKVLAITCVRGNVPTHQVVVNVFKILQLANRCDVPVYSGNDYGLVETVPSDGYFGADGLLNVSLPQVPTSAKVEEEPAAAFMARIVREHPGKVNFLAIGPLTNFALALHLNPDFLQQALRVVILGGCVAGRGNVAPDLEFNFYADAAASHFVLEQASKSDSIVTIMPCETIMNTDLTYDFRFNTVSKLNNSVVRVLDELERKLQQVHALQAYQPYDVFAAADLLSDQFVTLSQNLYGFVEYESQNLRGHLSVDYDNITKKTANLEVILEVNDDVLKSKIVENLSTYS